MFYAKMLWEKNTVPWLKSSSNEHGCLTHCFWIFQHLHSIYFVRRLLVIDLSLVCYCFVGQALLICDRLIQYFNQFPKLWEVSISWCITKDLYENMETRSFLVEFLWNSDAQDALVGWISFKSNYACEPVKHAMTMQIYYHATYYSLPIS